MDVDALRGRKRELQAELATLRLQAKRARRNVVRRLSSMEREWLVAGDHLKVTLAIYMLTDYSMDASVAYLKRMGRQRRWPNKTHAELIRIVEELFLNADLQDLVLLSDWWSDVGDRIMQTAADFAWQWRLVAWSSRQNYKGIAPPTAIVLDEWARARAEVPAHLRPTGWGHSAQVSARMRVMRWRRRFAGRSGQIPPRERVPLETMRNKAHTTALRTYRYVSLHSHKRFSRTADRCSSAPTTNRSASPIEHRL